MPGELQSRRYSRILKRCVLKLKARTTLHSMANQATSSSTPPENRLGEEDEIMFGAESGWVEAMTSCDHLGSLSSDLAHIPTPDTPCNGDLSVWCFTCDAYLDAQVIQQLRPVYEAAYILKFGEAPPFRTVEEEQTG